ncbi:MAG: UDP-N-acetylglucosamine 2-epimerase (non-hydrolyzing) [Anaerolineales bacterium]|nr:UDP-N-acetylglucosamine 2-epimerase (non-hydrolyzing) [Chloroflexota bacterium]MBL7162943.1 UDP-N-acetylglucosamine 2-epimerase (non-hydrolyzing) [Anaerolineales bacterium]
MHIINVVGTRPNFVKMAPIVEEMNRTPGIKQTLVHTGQHYDESMSRVFFDELGLPKPDIYLGVGSTSHARQTAQVMVAFEEVLGESRPDLVVVVGDVNSTMACAVTAAKLWIPVAHVEAGLRSFDRKMPEEINRIVTDALSDFLFTTSRGAIKNLHKEGIPKEKIFFVGNVMIDTLNKHRDRAANLNTPARFDLDAGEYALVTLHRAANVDDPRTLSDILDALIAIQQEIPILFAAHPRTLKRIDEFSFQHRLDSAPNLQTIEPLGYLQFLDLAMHAKMVLTDSGGIQEETSILNVPCLTIRENTERPITITEGTNTLVGIETEKIIAGAVEILTGKYKDGHIPKLWDGRAAERIVNIIKRLAPK